ncbi:MAG: DMT family transporter [Bacteroidetes bacterium]|jgi:drug/metabolite transporter (DMT)-like permease|nr:DMT family transporter [Bacteroidota bacterium]
MALHDPRPKAELILLSITFIWGSTFIVTKDLLSSVSPFAYIGLRFALATLLFGLVRPSSVRGWDRASIRDGVVLGSLLFAGFGLQTVGLQTTTASKSAFITGMMVVFTPLWQVTIERRWPKLGTWIGVALVSVGLYYLTSPAGSGFVLGDLLTLGCALLFGLYIVLVDVFSKRTDVAHLTMAQFVVAAFGGGIAALTSEQVVLRWSGAMALEIVYLAIFATVIALWLQTTYQRFTTPARSAVIFSLEPVIAAVLAYLVVGERLGALGVLGGGLILVGLLVSELSDVVFRPKASAPGPS